MPDKDGGDPSGDVLAAILGVLGSFNNAGVELSESTRFAEDLNFDSLIVMEFVAGVEDRLDISVPLNILPDIENVGQLATAIREIIKDEHG